MRFCNGEIAWYDVNSAADAAYDHSMLSLDTVAGRLAVGVSDANAWKYGSAADRGVSKFRLYGDVPLSPWVHGRLNFFAQVPDAAELDPTFQFEPQMYALDVFSQLFAESCTYHFGFLADLDNEYHRLRSGGPVGIYNDTKADSPWHHAYHYFRDMIENTYLESGLIKLPAGARSGNWRIVDVLHELMRKMSPDGSNLLPDIRLTSKGVARGQTGLALGLQQGEGYLDGDGNSRFYFPWMDADITVPTSTLNTLPIYGSAAEVANPRHMRTMDTLARQYGRGWSFPSVTLTGEALSSSSSNIDYAYATGVSTLADLTVGVSPFLALNGLANEANGAVNMSQVNFMTAADTLASMSAVPQLSKLALDLNLSSIKSLPTTGETADAKYWTGHTLNLFELIDAARKIGRALEPEVAEMLLPAFGQVTAVSDLMVRGTGPSVRQMNDLYNIYSGKFSFNENPSRTYTAAHLGPSDIKLAKGELSLEGMSIHTEQDGKVVSAREKYWTPALYENSEDMQPVFGALLAGTQFELGTFGEINMAVDFPNWPTLNKGLVSRVMGTNPSMYTKVEKPVLLPAGKATAESVYASGSGLGTLQLLAELIFSGLDSVPRFGLGHSGFSDIVTTGGTLADPVRRLVPRLDDAGSDSVAMLYGDNPASDLVTAIDNDSMAVNIGSALMNEGSERATEYLRYINGDASVFSASYYSPSQESGRNAANSGADTALVLPSQIIAGKDTMLLGSTVYEKSPLSHWQQWGYFSLLGSALGSLGSNPAVAHSHTTPSAAPMDMIRFIRGVKFTVQNDRSPFVVDTDAIIPGGDPLGLLSGISYERVFGDCGGRTEVIAAEPIITANASSPQSSKRIHPQTATSTNGSHTWLPNLTPMQLALRAINLYNRNATVPLTPAVDANGKQYVDFEFQTEICAQLSTAGTPSWQSSRTHDGYYVDALTLPGVSIGTCTQKFRLTQTDESPWFQDISSLDLDVQFKPAIGSATPLAVEQKRLGGVELTFEGIVESSFSMANFVNELQNGANPSLYMNWSSDTLFGWAGAINANNFLGFMPPVHEGVPMSSNESFYFETPTDLSTMAGQLDVGRLNHQFNSNWHGEAYYGREGLDPQLFQDSAIPIFNTTMPYIHADKLAHINRPIADGGEPLGVTVLTAGVGTVKGNMIGWLMQGLTGQPPVSSDMTVHSQIPYRFNSFSIVPYIPTSSGTHFTIVPSELAGQAICMYPDDPEHKMLYRPWRYIVDSAVAKELRYTFLNLGDRSEFGFGELGIETIGSEKEMRFAELVRSDNADVFVLEKASSKTRMVNPDHRSILTFSRVSMLDPSSLRHQVADAARLFNAQSELKGFNYASSSRGLVYNRALLREVQSGRQAQREV
jgi:hypothetical protein